MSEEEDGVTSESDSQVTLSDLERLESELSEVSQGTAREALDLGQSLITQIRTEEDYPPDYLNNVQEKVDHLREVISKVYSNLGQKEKPTAPCI